MKKGAWLGTTAAAKPAVAAGELCEASLAAAAAEVC